MYIISKGKTKSLDEIAMDHYLKLNFKSDKTTPLLDSPINYLYSLIELYKTKKDIISKNKVVFLSTFFDIYYKEIELIFLCKPLDFPSLISKVNKLLKKNNLKPSNVRADFESIFKYENWRQSNRSIWFFDQLNLSVCPYCNYDEIFKTNNSKKLFFDYDHYYKKSEFPYLALSFYNLVPSCHKCNSNAKSISNFSTKTHLHPYLNNYHHLGKFELSYKPIRFDDPFDILITSTSKLYKRRFDRINKDLELVDRYNSGKGKEKVIAVKKKQNAYSETQIEEYIKNSLYADINSRQDAINFMSDFPIEEQEIANKLYGKLQYDMAFVFEIYKLP